jgi:hypothetical protein
VSDKDVREGGGKREEGEEGRVKEIPSYLASGAESTVSILGKSF